MLVVLRQGFYLCIDMTHGWVLPCTLSLGWLTYSPLSLSRWALTTCPRKRKEIKQAVLHTERQPQHCHRYQALHLSPESASLPHFEHPPPQLASCFLPTAHLATCTPDSVSPPSLLPQSLLGSAHFPHTFPSVWPMHIILSMGPPCPLLDLNSLSVLVLEDAMCGIRLQSRALTSGHSPALYHQRYCVSGWGFRGHPGKQDAGRLLRVQGGQSGSFWGHTPY
jgi:hypothetical protein